MPLGCPLLCDAATPVLCIFFVVRPLLPPSGAVQLLQPLLCTEYFTTGVMAVAGVEMVLCIIVVLLNTYMDIKDIDPTCVYGKHVVLRVHVQTCTNIYMCTLLTLPRKLYDVSMLANLLGGVVYHAVDIRDDKLPLEPFKPS